MKRELTLEEIHEELLEQLPDITAICDRYGIEYNTRALSPGTTTWTC